MMRDCLAALIVMVLYSGCTADEAAAPERANDPSTDRSTTPSATPAPSASQPSGRVRVDVTSQV
ncbi:MAG: hypothetical protein M3445_03175, partial [Actinomycetota bacterium]|nr:hypothetical protein [Actinomycetota bacterium]